VSQVLDYSGRPPSAAAVAAAGYIGAVRYLSWEPNLKVLSPREAQDYWAHGLKLALVWEVGADPLGSDPVAAGREAARQAAADGFPMTVPIYVAFDYDAQKGDWAPLAGWGDEFDRAAGHPWRGYCRSALGEQLVADGHFPCFWDPYAWSGEDGEPAGQPTPHACLFQRLETVPIDGTDCDVNDVLMDDWGGWSPTAQPPPPHPDPPIIVVMTGDKDVPKLYKKTLTLGKDPSGPGAAGYFDLGEDVDSVITCDANGADPAAAHRYYHFDGLTWEAVAAGITRVQVTSPDPALVDGQVLVRVFVTTAT
jgi:hypothetical protein